MVRNHFRKEIYTGPARNLYDPTHFLIFMNQGQTGNKRYDTSIEREFQYGTELVHVDKTSEFQVWHVNHYGVTVCYEANRGQATITLFGEDVPMPLVGRTPEDEVKSPKDLVEDIIKKKAESEDKRYKELEKIVR